MRDTVDKAVVSFSGETVSLKDGAVIEAGSQLSELNLEQNDDFTYTLRTNKDGSYVVGTEHYLEEFDAYIEDSNGKVEPLHNLIQSRSRA